MKKRITDRSYTGDVLQHCYTNGPDRASTLFSEGGNFEFSLEGKNCHFIELSFLKCPRGPIEYPASRVLCAGELTFSRHTLMISRA